MKINATMTNVVHIAPVWNNGAIKKNYVSTEYRHFKKKYHDIKYELSNDLVN